MLARVTALPTPAALAAVICAATGACRTCGRRWVPTGTFLGCACEQVCVTTLVESLSQLSIVHQFISSFREFSA